MQLISYILEPMETLTKEELIEKKARFMSFGFDNEYIAFSGNIIYMKHGDRYIQLSEDPKKVVT